ncbi:hypothetical protein [Duganella sp. P38]|uniref:hypothetical protein n=1 Tax=Duganella sp. P38 TaxID=3423949 RepID=UPI003D79441B
MEPIDDIEARVQREEQRQSRGLPGIDVLLLAGVVPGPADSGISPIVFIDPRCRDMVQKAAERAPAKKPGALGVRCALQGSEEGE